MEIIPDVRIAGKSFPRLVLTVGSFDGVHLGHRRVLEEVLRIARETSGAAGVMTLDPHPREFFSPQHAPNLLTSPGKKLDLLHAAGVDVTFILPFDATTAALDRRDYVEQIIHARCHAKELVVGHDFRFGRDASGDYEFLAALGPALGFGVRQVPPLFLDGERVSSTVIRERILEGDLDGAEALLGRKYSVVGEVIAGRGIGLQLGFPTANLKPHHTAIPAQGVYVAEALIANVRLPAAVNIGIAPTVRHEDTTIEAFLLDFHGDIRGREIEIVFHKRLRPEQKFASHEELIQAIRRDVETVRRYFAP